MFQKFADVYIPTEYIGIYIFLYGVIDFLVSQHKFSGGM